MELIAQKNAEKILSDKKVEEIVSELRKLVYQLDENAEIILFGSRARGDWHDESDWDFLILTDLKVTEELKAELRNNIMEKIEVPLNEGVFIIVKNKIDWEENYNVMPLFYNISDEGISI